MEEFSTKEDASCRAFEGEEGRAVTIGLVTKRLYLTLEKKTFV